MDHPVLIPLSSRRSNSRSAMLSSSQKKEMKLAVMLMIVVLVFLICNVLSLVVNILEVFEISYKPLTEISNLGRTAKLNFLPSLAILDFLVVVQLIHQGPKSAVHHSENCPTTFKDLAYPWR